MKVKSPHFLAVAALLEGLVAHALLCFAPVQTQLSPPDQHKPGLQTSLTKEERK